MLSSQSNTRPIEEEVIQDHHELRQCYDHYKATGDMKWYNQFVWELSRHSVGEELILYPVLETLGDMGKRLADEARQEHHKAKEMLTRMEHLSSRGPKSEFDTAWASLMTDLDHHMKKEEQTELPMIREKQTLDERVRLARKFENRKKIAPTRPHTSAPEKPVLLEEVMGLLVAPADKFRDLFRDYPETTA